MTCAERKARAFGSTEATLRRLIGFDVRIDDWDQIRTEIKTRERDGEIWFQKEPLPRYQTLGPKALCVWVAKDGDLSEGVRRYLLDQHNNRVIRLLPYNERP